MARRSRFSPEVRERAVRMVLDHQNAWLAVGHDLRRANEILRKTSAFFAQAELDRRPK